MIICTCIDRFRNKQNQIIGYRIQDTEGNIRDVTPYQLKNVMIAGKLDVTNLKLTSDNKLVVKQPNQNSKILSADNKVAKNDGLELSYEEKQKLLQYVNQKYSDNFYHYVFGHNFGLILHPCRRGIDNNRKTIYTHIVNIRVKDKECADLKLPMFTWQQLLNDGDNFIVIARVASSSGEYGSEHLAAYGAFKDSFGKIKQLSFDICGKQISNINKDILKKMGNMDTFEPIEFYNTYRDGNRYIMESNYNFKIIVDIQNRKVEVVRQ